MNDAFKDVWPSGVPTSLWNYDLLQPGKRPSLPMMGFEIQPSFAAAFIFGACVIAMFAWQRFKKRTFDPSAFDSRVIRELDPTQLGGAGPMRRAYGYYAGILILIYAALTFFGGLILRTVSTLPMAGLQVDLGQTDTGKIQWPLTLAFAMAGFAPMFRPVEIAETWIRQLTHKWVGIPVRIKERTRDLLTTIEERVPVAADAAQVPQWAEDYLRETESLEGFLRMRQNLRTLLRLTRDERDWPEVRVRDDLRRLEGEEVEEAESTLQDLEEILAAPRGKDQRRQRAKFQSLIDRMERAENDLGATLSVYAERDKEFDAIADPALRQVMETTFPPLIPPQGPDLSIRKLLIPIFIAYYLTAVSGAHSLLTGADRLPLMVFVTAAVETTRIAVLFWLPVLVVFFWRNLVGRRWEPILLLDPSGRSVGQAIRVLALAGAASLLGLGLLALVSAFLVSENELSFRQALLGPSNAPVLPYYLWQAGAGALNAFVIVCAADDDESRLPWWAYGGLNVLLVVGWMVAHLSFRGGLPSCTAGGWFLLDALSGAHASGGQSCYRYYNLTDFLVYALVAGLGAGIFAPPRDTGFRASKGVAATAVMIVAFLVVVLAGTLSASAEEPAVRRSIPIAPDRIVVAGFRGDAEPFSFLSRNGAERRFDGYMADLCYDIFEGSYFLVPSLVSASDRFSRLRTSAGDRPYDPSVPTDEQKVDVLCDPVTLRFSQPEDRAKNGIFSPIVFASGASYMLRPSRVPHSPAYLVYVGNSTAPTVAKLACEIDLLGILGESKQEDCVAPDQVNGDCPPDGEATGGMPSGAAAYHFCVKSSHSEIIELFCGKPKEMLGYAIAYIGDRELIQGRYAAWKDQGGDCPPNIEVEHPYYTYEPYALLITKTRPDLVQYVQRRVYELFSYRSGAVSLFRKHFPGVTMSPVLANLFLLNAVAEEKFYRSSPPTKGSNGNGSGLLANARGKGPF